MGTERTDAGQAVFSGEYVISTRSSGHATWTAFSDSELMLNYRLTPQ